MKACAQLTLLCWRHSILNLLDRTWISNRVRANSCKFVQIRANGGCPASLCCHLVLCAAVTGNCPLIKLNWTQKLVHPNAPRLSGVCLLLTSCAYWVKCGKSPRPPGTAVELPEVTSESHQPSPGLLVWRHTWVHRNRKNCWEFHVVCIERVILCSWQH